MNMKKTSTRLRASSILVAIAVILIAILSLRSVSPANAQSQFTSLTGWAWSDTIGWISMNCDNTSSCGYADYGISVGSDGTLSGYAWSDNIGWVSADHADVAYCENELRWRGSADTKQWAAHRLAPRNFRQYGTKRGLGWLYQPERFELWRHCREQWHVLRLRVGRGERRLDGLLARSGVREPGLSDWLCAQRFELRVFELSGWLLATNGPKW